MRCDGGGHCGRLGVAGEQLEEEEEVIENGNQNLLSQKMEKKYAMICDKIRCHAKNRYL